MKNLFEATSVDELTERIGRLRPESERLWGTMTPAQMLAHLSAAMEMAVGDCKPPRMFLGRIFGGFVKAKAVGGDGPTPRNAPTAQVLVVRGDRDFGKERARLLTLLARFATAGPKGCTTHPHTFFGPLTPEEWATLMYKHVDHHLQQFGV